MQCLIDRTTQLLEICLEWLKSCNNRALTPVGCLRMNDMPATQVAPAFQEHSRQIPGVSYTQLTMGCHAVGLQ